MATLNKLSFLILLIIHQSFGLNIDGIILLSFKSNILNDPLHVLDTWSYSDVTPCSWNGVVCENFTNDPEARVTRLSLANSGLTGSLPANMGLIQHMKEINLSNNFINGSIPLSLYTAPELESIDVSNNLISGEIFGFVGGWKSLRYLNVSNNLLTGKLPQNLALLANLTVVSLKGNYFYGEIANGFSTVQILDISSNLINGSLPKDFGSDKLTYFNVSHNNVSGEITPEFANKLPTNATIDLSFNNLTGAVPESSVYFNQDEAMFMGNMQLCGRPLKNLCVVPSSISNPPNVSSDATPYPPAIAGIPETLPSSSSNGSKKSKFKTSTIVGIVVGDIVGVAVLAMIFIFILKRRQRGVTSNGQSTEKDSSKEFDWGCLMKRRSSEGEEQLSETSSSGSDETEMAEMAKSKFGSTRKEVEKKGLVTVDGGEKELELETLLKASAYILGATGSSIIYKAVLEDGTALAVRRIGESGLERFRDFENQVRVIAKLVHPNLVRVRGFYWGVDEKLVIYDYVPYGSLADARYRKVGSSPCPLPWEVRLKIAKGTARGLLYIHEKKQVHGNLKPSNILLGSDMEPKIGDFGLERLVVGNQSCKVGGSTRNFGSMRSTASRDSFVDIVIGSNLSPSPSAMGCVSPYYAPESLRSIKPNPKWDVYSYGVVLLELLTGKVIVSDEFGPAGMTWSSTLTVDEKKKVLRMVDVAIRGNMEGKEDALLALLRVAYNCISPVPQKRPHMKEVLHALDKFPSTTFSYY
ncbi:Leucine-rich repeat-containing protein [Artemisia annua]|uniref:Leucine-rich repeat-containing protein n=1 Tax=Artemisia annua TaxID=35608 RepID=A0A2U1KWM8_ARTAN|nr:Leucine-rich repeat-containing protein [Artemisia annua]